MSSAYMQLAALNPMCWVVVWSVNYCAQSMIPQWSVPEVANDDCFKVVSIEHWRHPHAA